MPLTLSAPITDEPTLGTLRKPLTDGLTQYGESLGIDFPFGAVAWQLTDGNDQEGGNLVGGLFAKHFGKSTLYIDLLWVHQNYRGQHWGERLMQQAEAYAAQHGFVQLTVNTLGFQAPEFYTKLGYEEFGTIALPLDGTTMHHYIKRL